MMVIVIHVVMLVGGLIAFFHHQNKLRTRAHLMREATLNRDFTFRLPVNGLFYGEKALQEVLNDLGKDIA